MKLTSHRMVGWRTSCQRGLVVILGLIAAGAISAQENKTNPIEPANQRASGKVPAGMSVASVPLDPTMTGSGLIRAGNRVDVLVIFSRVVDSQGVSKTVRDISTVLEDVEVFAIDGDVRDRKAQVVKNVQLLVTTEQARQLKQAGDKGTIYLTLRAANDATTPTEFVDSEEPAFGRRPRTNAPNIGGRWRKAERETDEFAIRPRRNGAGFEIASLDDNQPLEGTVDWSRENGRFEGTATIPRNFKGSIPLVLVPEDGGKKMHVRFSLSEQQRKEMIKHWQEFSEKHRVQEIDSWKEKEEALIASCHQVWVRGSVGVPPSSSHPAVPAASEPRLTVSAVPDTPAAKQLVEQLGTQESAAAAEAATIRQLQANGQAEQNRQPIAEHQRKLKNLLSTAFDLKLQVEELQVKELQSRLSRLERQIGQRKELREKIINRRAEDLLNPDLNWDTKAASPLVTAGGPTELEGEWSLESIKGGGVMAHEMGLKLRVRNHQWTVLRGEQESRYSFEVNPTTKPKSIRIIGERIEGHAPYSAKGIYALEGDTLMIDWGTNGRGQPSGFDAQESSIHTWKRIREVNEHLQSHINSPAGAAIATLEQNVVVVDLYAGSQVLPGLGRNPKYSKLVQSLSALKGVTVNFREAGQGDVIVMAIVRDPSQRCQREARQTQKESELRIAINLALKAAGIEATRWDESEAAAETSADESAVSNRNDERTFDGTPYSQWLKMLETERKPDKLAMAMEACARLAATGDERRIARGLFVAAKLFEATDNTKERDLVWNAGTAALKRLPGEAVVAELLAVLHDEPFNDACEFQCRFLISVATSSKSSVPDGLKAAFKRHDQELVTTLLKARGRVHEFQNSPISSSPLPKSKSANSEIRTPDPSSGNNRLLAGAASVWLISERKLSDFDGLPPNGTRIVSGKALAAGDSPKNVDPDSPVASAIPLKANAIGLAPLVMAAIDEVYSRTTGRIDRREEPWLRVTGRLVATEPETPGLAILLAKHIHQDRTTILGRLTKMGTHAEPAVPLLIEDFLALWKSREQDLRHSADNAGTSQRLPDPLGDLPLSEADRMVDVLNVLGAIGPKAKSAVPLLRQIVVTATARRAEQPSSLNDRLFNAVKKALALIGDVPAAELEGAPILLSEFARLQGSWNLSSLTPNADHKDIRFEFDWQLSIEDKHVRGNFDVVIQVMSHIGAKGSSMLFRINDTVTPGQIELIDREKRHRQLGIYELKGHRLKIELAKPGLPCPKEFSADPNKLPAGHVLLELDR